MSQIGRGEKRKAAGDTRRRLIEAAERLSREVGPAGMSLDAVAAAAGVSKGGLLYHFPSKHALLRALVEDHVAAFAAEMERRAPGWEDAPAGAPALQAARAYLDTLRNLLQRTEAPAAGIFAALTEDPLFMAPLLALRVRVRALFARCPAEAMVVFLGCEGILHDQLIDPEGRDAARSAAELELLVRLLDRIAAA